MSLVAPSTSTSAARRSLLPALRLLVALALLVGGLTAGSGAVAVAAAADPETSAPSSLTVNGIGAPVDLDTQPRFGWHVGTSSQTAYEIAVSSTAARAAGHEGDVWSSGKVASSQQNVVPYGGEALAKQERYFWTVRTWDADGQASAWSAPADFGTGPGETWADSSPVWAPTTFGNWGDFTLDTDFTVVQNAAAITFRTTSTSSFYLWQIRSDTNTLKTHYGTTVIDETPLADKGLTIRNGETHHLRIEANGATVKTWIDDVLVRSGSTHSTYLTGGFGFRTGSTEQATFDNLVVKDLSGTTLYSNDFESGSVPELPTLSVAGGRLVVGASRNDYVGGSWSNYTVRSKVKVTDVATGLAFRATDAANSYMWQLRGADNQLRTHRQVAGTYTALKTVTLPAGTLALGKEVSVRIEAVGTTIRTWIDDVLVDTTTDTTFRRGAVGFRNGLTESAQFSDFSVKDSNTGGTLVATSFAAGDDTFACGSSTGGVLTVGKGEVCLLAGLTSSWAFLRGEAAVKDKEVAWASAYATGSNPKTAKQYVYKLYLNGTFVGLGPTQPVAGETRYDGFDVTDLVRSGSANALSALAYTTNDQKFQAQLVVEYTDGTRDVFGTGSSWKARSGDSVFPGAGSIGTSYFVAPKENLDARKYPWGFDRAGFDDSAWRPATVKAALPTLTSTPTDKVQQQLRKPVKIVDKGNGNYFVDFGRTWIGGVSYRVDQGVAGTPVDIRFGEVPSSENTVKYALNTGNTYQDVPILKDGQQTVTTWGARVFRYVEIVGAPEPVTADNLQALALVYPFDEDASTFSASDDSLEQVYGLSKNTIESLNLNFYTDSWTRERTNYEADAYLQQMSSLYLMDDLSLGRYSMNYFRSNRTWPTEWPVYVILAVHDAWQQTGDTVELAAYYDNLKTKLPSKWLEASTGLIRKDSGSNGCSSVTDCDIVDWPTSERDGFVFQPYNTVINAISYRAYRDMAAIATELGKDDEAATYTGIADRMRTAMNDAFYDDATGAYRDGMSAAGVKSTHFSVHASAFSLAFGVPQDAQRPAVAKAIKARGMACSVYCAAFLVKALYDGGDGQTALDMLTGTGTRSWMNMIKLGAGSTAEAWDPSLKSNLTYSHPWAASPAFNVPSGLFGIQPLEPGYEAFQVKPQPGDLASSSITVPTVRGSIGAAFEHDAAGAMQLKVTVPGNSTATVHVPLTDDADDAYVPSHAKAAVYEGRTTISGNVYATFTVGTGSWTFGPGEQPAGTVTAEVSGQAAAGWLGPDAALTLTATGTTGLVTEYRVGAGDWETYESPVDLADGSYAVGYRVRQGDDVLDAGTVDVKVDGTAPQVVATTAGRSVTLASSDSGSGVATTEYRVDDGPWTAYTSAVTVDADQHAVEHRATDVAGNSSTPGRVDLDAVHDGPTVVATVSQVGADGWYGRGAALTVSAGDGAKVPKLEYAVDGGEWSTWTSPVELAAGEQTIAYRATSTNGAVSQVGTLVAKVDLTMPTVTAAQDGRVLTLEGADTGSGVASVEYRLDGGGWLTYAGPVTVDGAAHVVEHRATDVAGNRSDVTSTSFGPAPTGPAAAPVATQAPSIGGSLRVGGTLTATPGVWDRTGLSFGYRWLRDGQVVTGATASTYRLTAADVKARITVQVTASLAGHTDGVAQSARTRAVPKATSVTRLRVDDRTIRSGRKLRTTVRVTSPAGVATGTVVVTYRGRVTRVLTLEDGEASATFRPRVKGRHTLKFTYRGNGVTAKDTDRTTIGVR